MAYGPFLALTLSGSLALGVSGPAGAGAMPAEQPLAETPSAPPVVDVNVLFSEGQAASAAGRYDEALRLWQQAYAEAPATAGGRAFRVGIAAHMAVAHEFRYRQLGASADLDRAAELLRWHIDEYKVLYPPTVEARSHITEMNAWLARLEGARTPRAAGPAAPPVAAVPARRPSSKAQVRHLLRTDPDLHAQYRSGKGMQVGGGVMLGMGGVLLLVATVVAEGPAGTNDPQTNTGALLTGLMAVALVGGGIPLMVIGSKRKNDAVRDARRRVSFSVLPGGLQLRGTF